jgi:pyoverdine/dityrosine biosynthesis protein Dit1
VLPAFPAKSPNTQKVLGSLPDKAERLALEFLKSLCDEIKSLYSPGAHITICSDGRVFSDVVGVSDEDVTAYQAEVGTLANELGGGALSLFALDQVISSPSFDEMRERLVSEYGDDVETIRSAIKASEREKILFNGIERFLFEDFLGVRTDLSRNKVRQLAHETAYSVVQRSHAWSSLVEARFPEAIRLSIHPQPCHHTKLGIQLMDSKDNWITPWHAVAVQSESGFRLMKRHEAEALGAVLQQENGRPSYFLLSYAD